jgi:hypothetical protein
LRRSEINQLHIEVIHRGADVDVAGIVAGEDGKLFVLVAAKVGQVKVEPPQEVLCAGAAASSKKQQWRHCQEDQKPENRLYGE